MTLCRTCLKETNESSRNIFKEGQVCGIITTLSYMLMECASVESDENDGLSNKMCMECVLLLSRSFMFRQECIKSDFVLRERLQNMQDIECIYDKSDYHENDSNEFSNNDVSEIIQEDCDQIEMNEENLIYESEENEEHEEHQNSAYDYQVVQHQNEIETIQPDKKIIDENTEADGFQVVEVYEEVIIDDIKNTTKETNNENYNFHGEQIKISNDDTKRCVKLLSDKSSSTMNSNESASSSNVIYSERNNKNQLIHKMIKRSRKRKLLPGPPFKCEECGKILKNHSSYQYHKLLHSDNYLFQCTICDERFKTPNAFEGHMTTHDKNNPHTCKICGKSYRQAGSLKSHMLVHTGERPFICAICGKGSTQKSGFKKHMLTHTGEQPYKCDICGKKFRYKSNLLAHQQRGHKTKKKE